jgi:hypothetical protein
VFHARDARGSTFFERGHCAQPRGKQLELEFYGREHEVAEVAAEGTDTDPDPNSNPPS